MTWVIKVHGEDSNVEYLHEWRTNCYGDLADPEWAPEQKYAHRFADRNHAARIAWSGAVQNYHDNPQIVRLRPSQATSEDPKR